MQPGPSPEALLLGPCGNVGQQSQPVKKTTQPLNKFIHGKTQDLSGRQPTGYKLQKLLSEQP